MQLESRRWFQYVVGLGGVAITLALAVPIYLALQAHSSWAVVAVPFLAAGAVAGFSHLLTLFLPVGLLKLWPELEQPAL
ncbi:MAG: hypothetical protein M3Y55_00495 [Pseudomonadota bacterium]|nr:hypothetical protein [Pseudomonadota bacterium]